MSDIQPGDAVVCVDAEFSTCAYHNLDRFVADPNPQMVGRHYTVGRLAASSPDCAGLIFLVGHHGAWCVGCFRKIDKADEKFSEAVRAYRPIKRRERQPA